MKSTTIFFLSILLITAGCKRQNQTADELITVDVTKNSFPKKELVLQDFMDVEYIPLETNDEFVNQGCVEAVGEKYIIVANYNNDGTINQENSELKGNQFVWIPCTEGEYIKSEVWNGTTQKPGTLANSGWDKTTYTSELPQIRKYEGFYVARYEAGLAETIPEFTSTQQHTGSNQVYNKEGKTQSRAGVIPWNFIDWTTSQKIQKICMIQQV